MTLEVVQSINGVPIARSVQANRQLYERLKSQRRFAILVLRKGQRVVLSYEVKK